VKFSKGVQCLLIKCSSSIGNCVSDLTGHTEEHKKGITYLLTSGHVNKSMQANGYPILQFRVTK
jgi:hypothetical protein